MGTNYFVSFDGTQIYYEDFGSGTPIVFVHGWTGSHSVWERQVHDLSMEFRTVSFDNRGHGESGKPNSNYDFDEFSSDLRSLFAELNLSDVVLVAWSMGVSIVLRYFERFGRERVSKLVLVNGPVKLSSTPEFQHTMPEEYLERLFDERIDNRPMREKEFLSGGFYKPHAEATDWLTSIALKTPLYVAMKCVRNQLKLDMRPVLAKISVPTLVEYGRHDPFYPVSLGVYMAEKIMNSRLVVFESSGHYPFLEESDLFSKELESFARQ